MSLKYEPSLEPLHISAKYLFHSQLALEVLEVVEDRVG